MRVPIVTRLLLASLVSAGIVNGFTRTSASLSPRLTTSKSNLFAKGDEGGLEDSISDFCIGTNNFWRGLVIEPVRTYVETRPAGTNVNEGTNALQILTSPPEVPGIPRPVWLTIAGSVPTLLGWYGYYKFSAEEELFQYELQESGKVSGAGGYGTLFPFVYGVLIGFPLSLLHIPLGETIVQLSGAWILASQLNLYRRVNEMCTEDEKIRNKLGLEEPPLWEWWALLPPPMDVVVGLRQVHFLAKYWEIKRGYGLSKDLVADDLFPFISLTDRLTLKQFFRKPCHWFWFTKDWDELDLSFLQDK